eukprot:15365167-Ditylum_brightwellii.AAC.2
MIDAYDQPALLLKYSSQFIDKIADSLHYNTKQNNGILLGTSAISVASSIAEVVSIATIFTHLGLHLLLTSLLFSGTSTAVQTGSEAINYFAEPNKLANKIISLRGMMNSEQLQTSPFPEDVAVKSGINNKNDGTNKLKLDQTANWMEAFLNDARAYGVDRGFEAFHGACG